MGTFVRRVLGQSTARVNSFSTNLNSRETRNAMFRQLRHYSYDMCKAKECPPITVRYAHLSDFDNVVSFMKDNFLKHDPACTYLGIPNPPHHALLSHFYENLKDGMSLIAVEQNNCIVGAVINTAVSHWTAENTMQFADCCLTSPEKDLLKFYAYITEQPNLWDEYCVAKVFDCTYLAVDPEWRGKGIAKKLVEQSWYLARDCAFDIFRIDCTSSYSVKIAENFGWKCVYSLPYNLYVVDNESVFKNVKEPHTQVKVFIDLPKFYEDDSLHYGEDSKKRKKKK